MRNAKPTASGAQRRFFLLRLLKPGDRGQSLVEFSLILPVLLVLVLGSIDFGRVFFAYVSVTNAARNGAQYASFSSDAAGDLNGIQGAALADTSDLLDTSPTNPGLSVSTGMDGQGNLYADVTVTYTYSSLFPWPGLPSSVDVERTVRARVGE